MTRQPLSNASAFLLPPLWTFGFAVFFHSNLKIFYLSNPYARLTYTSFSYCNVRQSPTNLFGFPLLWIRCRYVDLFMFALRSFRRGAQRVRLVITSLVPGCAVPVIGLRSGLAFIVWWAALGFALCHLQLPICYSRLSTRHRIAA